MFLTPYKYSKQYYKKDVSPCTSDLLLPRFAKFKPPLPRAFQDPPHLHLRVVLQLEVLLYGVLNGGSLQR